MSNVITFPNTEGLTDHSDICAVEAAIHGTRECRAREGREADFAKWQETQIEIDRESYFHLNVLQQPDRAAWLARLPEPDKSVVIGNLRAAFNSGWSSRGSVDEYYKSQVE